MIWNFIIQLAIAAVFFVVGELLRPKPDFEDAEAIPYTEARIPQVDPQRKQPVIWGRVRLTSPHLMDVTEYETVEITREIDTSIFSSTDVTVGNRYFVGMQLGFCKGIADIKKLYYDDKVLWDRDTDPFTDEGDDGLFFDIDDRNFLGGRENGGGIRGRFRWYPGSPTQNRSVYLQAHQSPSPAYRWTSYLVLELVEVGETPNLDAFSIEAERYPNPLGLSPNRVTGDAALSELNPMSLVAELLTDKDFGFGLNPIVDVDTASFVTAAATLNTEGNGISLKWTNNQSIERLIETVSKQVDGLMRFDPKQGAWQYKLVRDNFVLGDLKTFNKDNIVALESFGRANWDETFNEVQVSYNQRDLTERPTPASAYDGSNWRRQGSRHRNLSLTFPGVYTKELARNLASRELRGQAFTLASASFTANRFAWDLLPGDPFILEWEDNLGITQLVMRVISMGFGDLQQTEIQISAVEDIFKLADNIFTAPADTAFTSPIQAAAQITVDDVFDQPYLVALSDTTSVSTPGTAHKPMYVAQRPNGNSTRLTLFAREGAADFTAEQEGSFVPSGVLNAALTENAGGDTDVIATLVIDNVSSVSTLDTTVLTTTQIKNTLNHLAIIVSSVDHPLIAGSAVYEPEIVAYESLTIAGTTITLNNVHRGLMDTLPVAANAGDRIWLISGEDIGGPVTTITEYAAGGTVDVRADNHTTTGVGPVSATETQTFRNRVNRPYPAGDFTIEGVRYPVATLPAAETVNFAWVHRDRTDGLLKLQQDASDAAEEASTEYVLELYNDTANSLVWTVRASGGDDTFTTNTASGVTYDWPEADQIAAGGPFAAVRAELKVENTTPGTNTDNIVDVIRVFTMIVPINFTRRGAPHFASVGVDTSGLIYPLAEEDGVFVEVNGVGSNGSIDGTLVGLRATGPSPLTRSVTLPGVDLGAVYVGSVNLPDNENFDVSNTTLIGWVHAFAFRVVQDGQANPRILWVKDDGSGAAQGLCLAVDSGGEIFVKHGATTVTIPSSLVDRVDDGNWHVLVAMQQRASGSRSPGYWLDGATLASAAPPTGLSDIGAHNVRLGGWSTAGADTLGWAKASIANIYSDGDVPTALDCQDVVAALTVETMQWTPFAMSSLGLLTGIWARGTAVAHTTMTCLDFSENFNKTLDGSTIRSFFSDPSDGDLTNSDSLRISNSTVENWTAGAVAHDPWSKSFDPNNREINLPPKMWTDIEAQQGPQTVGFYIALNPDNLTNDIGLFSVGATNTGGDPEHYLFYVNTDGRVHIAIANESRFGTANYTSHRTTNVCVVAGVWNHIYITNEPIIAWKVWVNGVEQPMDLDFASNLASGSASVPATDQFMNDRNPRTSGGDGWMLGAFGRPSTLVTIITIPGYTQAAWDGHIGEVGLAPRDTTWTEEQILIHYASGLKGFPTLQDILLDFNPENLMVVDDTAAADLRGNIITPTPNGTFPTDEEVPLGQDDLVKPQRFNRTNNNDLDYTSDHFLSSKGTGLIDNFSTVVIGQIKGAGPNQTFVANTNASNDFNFYHYWQESSTSFRFFPEGGNVIIGPDVQQNDPFAIVMTHQDDGGTDRWNFWEDAAKAVAEITLANAYTGAAIDRCRIGNLPAGGQALNGNVPYIAAYARTISDRHARRITLKYRGFNGAMLEIHTHIHAAESAIGFLYPLADRAMAVSGAENWVINDIDIQNLGLQGTHTGVKNSPTFGTPRFSQFASGSYLEAPFLGAGTYPFTLGSWVRVNSGTDAMVAVSNSAVSNQSLAIGVINGFAGIRMQLGAAAVEEVGTTAISVGTWAFVAVEFVSDVDRKLYLNGNLEASFVTSRDVNAQVLAVADKISVNRIIGPNTDFNGSYSLFWGVDADLTDAHHAVIYRETQHFSWRALAHRDAPVAQWLLDEPTDMVTDSYRDQYNNDYSAAPTSTGVTQGVVGILPSAPGLCVDLDGINGGINTGFTGYVAGAAERAFECWLEPGYVGVVVSMGANTDANSLVVSVDGSGDLSIKIRGVGNERIWTTALDVGTNAHHLLVQLPAAGDSLHDFEVWIDGVEQTTIGTAGTDTVLATTATLALHIGEDVTDLATADGTGKIYGVTVYDTSFSAGDIGVKNSAGRVAWGV